MPKPIGFQIGSMQMRYSERTEAAHWTLRRRFRIRNSETVVEDRRLRTTVGLIGECFISVHPIRFRNTNRGTAVICQNWNSALNERP